MAIDLSQAANQYLLTEGSTRSTQKAQLIANSPRTIIPLIKSAMNICTEFNPLRNLSRIPPRQVSTNFPRNLWGTYVATPAVKDVHEIVQSGGESAVDAVVRGLWEPDQLIKIFSALVLLEIRRPTSRTESMVSQAVEYLDSMDRDKRYYSDSALSLGLVIVMAQAGNRKAQSVVNEMAQGTGNQEDVEEITRNTILNYLFKETGK